MTVPAGQTPIKIYAYTGPGDYDFLFKVFEEIDLLLNYIDTEGTRTPLDRGALQDFTVSLLASGELGGTCHLTLVETGGSLEIRRSLLREQSTEWVNNSAFNTALLETDLDRAIMIIQEIQTIIDGDYIPVNWRGSWVTDTSYSARDLVANGADNWYSCIVPHTSGVFADDLASGYWVLVLDVEAINAAKDAAEAARDDAEVASDDAHASELQAGISAQEAANSSTAAHDSAVSAAADATSASTDADRAETAANVIPDPSAGSPGDVALINATQDGWTYDAGGGGGLVWSQAPSNSETGVAGEGLLFDTSTVVSTFTLPATPSEGDSVGVGDGSGKASVHKITVTSTGTIMGLSEDFYLDSDNQSFIFSYINSNWVVTGGMSSLGVGDIVTMHDTGLYPLAGNAYVTGNMYGLSYRETGDHTISVDAGNCMDSLNITPLVASALQTVTIPSVINEVYNLFLCDDGIVRTDTDVNGATLLVGSVSKLRWIGFVKTNASGIITRFTMVDDVLFFETFSEVTFLTGISTTMLAVDESPIVPVSRIKSITYGGQSNTDDTKVNLGDGVDYARFGFIRTFPTQSDIFAPWIYGSNTNAQNDMQPIGQVKSVRMSSGIGKIAVRGVTMRR